MQYPRIGEALVRGERHRLAAAEPELIIGDLNGPVGTAFATLLGGQVEGHTRVLALLNGDIAVKPATLMVSKVTVKKNKYTNILMGSVQAGIANGVLDAVRDGTIPRNEINSICIIAAVWLYPEVVDATDLDYEDLFTHASQEHARRDQKGDDWRANNRMAARESRQDRPQLPPERAGGKAVNRCCRQGAFCRFICASNPVSAPACEV